MTFPDSFALRLSAERLREHHCADVLRMHARCASDGAAGWGQERGSRRAAYLERNLNHWDRHGFGLWILRESAGGRSSAGRCSGISTWTSRDEVEVGYSFHPEHWGRGLATEIATTCVLLGREQLGLTTIVALTTPDNLTSQRVLVKAGLEPAGEVIHAGMAHSLFQGS